MSSITQGQNSPIVHQEPDFVELALSITRVDPVLRADDVTALKDDLGRIQRGIFEPCLQAMTDGTEMLC